MEPSSTIEPSNQIITASGKPRESGRAGLGISVTDAVGREAHEVGCPALADWCHATAEISKPRKADQDKLDAGICLAVALRWRQRPREKSIMIGDLSTGYMVTPASPTMRRLLTSAAAKMGGVPVDGISTAA